MRPQSLFPLFSEVSALKGVGVTSRASLKRLLSFSPASPLSPSREVPLIRDLIFHLPNTVVDRRVITTIADAKPDTISTLLVRVQAHYPPPARAKSRNIPYRLLCSDKTGEMQLVFFRAREPYLKAQLPEGQEKVISGKVEWFDGYKQMSHPDLIARPDQIQQVARLEPGYPLTQGLGQRQLGKLVQQSLARVPDMVEWIDTSLMKVKNWKSWKQSILALHAPQAEADIAPESPARARLAYDEILANQLALGLIRTHQSKAKAAAITPSTKLKPQLLAHLPFQLTQGQESALREIESDFASGHKMLRLLQGDVGSGKTLVALLAMLDIIESGQQAALMVPTEILAQQHFRTIQQFVEPMGLRVVLLTGSRSGKDRKHAQMMVESGDAHIAIGTHALFQETVQFKALGLVVIDEQHRFGVNQRLALTNKGNDPHVLLMTATPIPRTLTMTAYGDMECSSIHEKPAGRQKIDTRAVPLDRIDEVVAGIQRAVAAGSRVYWICPLVEESTSELFAGDLRAAEERYRVLQSFFGNRVGLVHGKMKGSAREPIMRQFATGEIDVLVATTVIEVGVDVPDATIIVIEHAERFGLSQLHQLRGRVGRGSKPSSCILLYNPHASEVARKRLKIIRECDDGFEIAEQDLMLRGSGDILGTRQSGFMDFRFVDLALHRDLIYTARDDVKMILNKDALLSSPRGEALRTLLYLFDYDFAPEYLKAG